jgi:hypothetical protein
MYRLEDSDRGTRAMDNNHNLSLFLPHNRDDDEYETILDKVESKEARM